MVERTIKALERQNRLMHTVTTSIDRIVMKYYTSSKLSPILLESPAKLSLPLLQPDNPPRSYRNHSEHSPHSHPTYTLHSPSHPNFSQLPPPSATPPPPPSLPMQDTWHWSQQTIPSPPPAPHSSQIDSPMESKSTSPPQQGTSTAPWQST